MKYFTITISLVSIILLSSCKNFEEIKVNGVEKFTLNKISLDGISGDIFLNIRNTNKVGFSIFPSEFDIVYSGIKLGKAKLTKRVKIKAGTEKSYLFKLDSDLKGINFLDISKLLNGEKLGRVEINGDLKVGKFLFRKKYPISFSDKINLLK